MIKIYSDKKYLSHDGACHMLIPFWGQKKDINDPDCDRFDKYIEDCKNIFEITNLFLADFAVFPSSPEWNKKIFLEFQNYVFPKKIIVFFNSDSDVSLNYRDNVYIFRTSFYKTTKKENEFALPCFNNDCGKFVNRKWEEIPKICFCGQTHPKNVRGAGLLLLKNNNLVNTDFIIRDGFWGSRVKSVSFGVEKKIACSQREEFLQNMNNNDYVFCARGVGNFSYRIYEAMMCGRIPILLNTDCVLPYDFLINWEKLIPIVDIKEINRMPEIILDFHNRIKNKFQEHQDLIRKTWEEYLSPTGFFKNILKHFEKH